GERIAEIQDQITELIAEQVESEMEFEEETAVTIEEMEEELEREMEEMEEDMEEAESEWEEDDSDWSDDDDADWSDDEDDDSEDDDDDFDIRIKRGDINFGHHRRGESRHTSQFVLAFGFNTLIANRDFSTINDSPVRAFNSKSFEWGFTGKQRM